METKEKRAPAKKTTKKEPAKKQARKPVAKRAPEKPANTTRKPTRSKDSKRRPAQKKPSADVVYVQPAPFNRSRFVLCLLIVVAVVLAVIFGMSIFFKVDKEKIEISGTNKYTAWDIREASGIHDGENLFSINEASIGSKIIDKLPYVNKVRVGIKLPDTVKIEIEELDVVYSVAAEDGSWWLLRSDGVAVDKTNEADAQLHTSLLGFQIAIPVQGEKVTAFQPVAEETGENGEDVPITVLASEQMDIALKLAQHLEEVGVIGQAKSIDTTNLGDIIVWYGEQYKVTFGDDMELALKVKTMKGAIDQMGDHQSGTLDVSFTTWPNEAGYTPFS